jgi:histidine triad (HIT) family protein
MLVVGRRGGGAAARVVGRGIRRSMAAGDEVARAQAAAGAGAAGEEVTLFDKIVSKEIPSTIVYEDDKALAFRDISPCAPTHILIIPKRKDGLSQLSKAQERHTMLLGHLMLVASKVAAQENLSQGYRIVVNDGKEGCQSVYHLHLHLIGGKQLGWPPGTS